MKTMEHGETVDPIIFKLVKSRRWFIRIGFVFCLVFMMATIVLSILLGTYMARRRECQYDQWENWPTWPSSNQGYLGNYSKAVVAADNGICSELGRNILIRGGNAVDATIATVLCVGILDAHSCGIGGGHLMTIYNRTTKTCLAIDARERAPLAAWTDMYVNNSKLAQVGWLAPGVPGEIHGLYTAYKLAGSGWIPWKDLVTPAADLCHFGYPVSGALAKALASQKENILKEESLRSIFVNNETGKLYEMGEVMKRPALAATLYQLANAPDPIQWFYNSSKTQTMVNEFQQNGGIMTMQDFREYKAKYGEERPIVTAKLGGDLIVCGPPPPSAAALTMAVLEILQGYNISKSKLEDPDYQVETYHRLLEAMKFTFGMRMQLGDMDFVKDALKIARQVTSTEYGQFVRSKITEETHSNLSYYLQGPMFDVAEDHGTSHVSVLDEQGNAVSITTTVNLYFGAKVRSPSTGIIWNDEMDDFSSPSTFNFFDFNPSLSNLIEPGKRPLSSMSPLIVYNFTSGRVTVVAGSAGGSRIIAAVAQMIMRMLWFGQDVRQAIASPRLHNQLKAQSEFEPGFPKAYLEKLIEKGHNFTDFGTFSTAATAIHQGEDGRVYANSDYRKAGGYPAGY